MNKLTYTLALGAALVGTTACQSSGPSGPDEFRVVRKAPLVVPPEYNLRPPQPGQAQPTEVDPTRTAVTTSFGTSIGQDASAAERALVAAADANAVSPVIREQIDFEEAKIIRKRPSVSDRIMFWQADEDGEPVEDSATGGEEVVIERGERGGGLKLPGT